MLASDIPAKFNIPFADSAGGPYIRPVPEASQIGIQNGAASLTDGFPPLCFTPVSSGGVPPFGEDFNGILNQITAWNQWQSAGGPVVFDGVFAAAIGGYPSGAILQSAVYDGLLWRSTADDNTTDPDSSSSANWSLEARAIIGQNTNFYVRSDGADTHNGLSNSAGGAFLTIQHAVDIISTYFDTGIYQAIINIGAGSFAGAGAGTIVGNGMALILSGAGATTIITSTMGANSGGNIQLQNMKLLPTATNSVIAGSGGAITLGSGLEFGAAAGLAHIYANAGKIFVNNGYTLSGAAFSHFQAFNNGIIVIAGGITITLTGTPAFSAFANADTASTLNFATNGGVAAFVGSATGVRYSIDNLSLISTGGAGASYLPGNSAGTAAHNAIYN